MTTNMNMIEKHWNRYKDAYEKQFKETPTSWFAYLRWLAQTPGIGNFTYAEIEYAQKVMEG